jgi:hypothetical protein
MINRDGERFLPEQGGFDKSMIPVGFFFWQFVWDIISGVAEAGSDAELRRHFRLYFAGQLYLLLI